MNFNASVDSLDDFVRLFITGNPYINKEACLSIIQKVKDNKQSNVASWKMYQNTAKRLTVFILLQNSIEIGDLFYGRGYGPESIIKTECEWPYGENSVETLRKHLKNLFRKRTIEESAQAKKYSGSFKGSNKFRPDIFCAQDEIIRLYKHEGLGSDSIALEFNCSPDLIRRILVDNDAFNSSDRQFVSIKKYEKQKETSAMRTDAEKTKSKEKRILTISKKTVEEKEKTRDKRISTLRKKYKDDTITNASQIREVHDKQQKFRWKDYTFKDGSVVKIQGFEWMALNELEENGRTINEISFREMETYTCLTTGKQRRYFPDIRIDDKIIEVKSKWTIVRERGKNRSILTHMIKANKNFEFWVYMTDKQDSKIVIRTMEEFDRF